MREAMAFVIVFFVMCKLQVGKKEGGKTALKDGPFQFLSLLITIRANRCRLARQRTVYEKTRLRPA